MNKHITYLFAGALLCMGSTFADEHRQDHRNASGAMQGDTQRSDNGCNTCKKNDCGCDCRFTPPCPPKTCAYNAPDVIDIDSCWDFYLEVTYALLKVGRVGSFALNEAFSVIVNGDVPGFENSGTINFYDTDYKSAVRAAVGGSFGCDYWSWNVGYLGYHADASKTTVNLSSAVAEDSTQVVASVFGTEAGVVSESAFIAFENAPFATKEHYSIDVVDFDLSRKYYVGRCLTFNTFFGLRAAWIDLNVTGNLFSFSEFVPASTFANVEITQNTDISQWGLGPHIALHTDWNFYRAFRIFGHAGAAILYSEIDRTTIDNSWFCSAG